ncbi:phage tail assembly chaperone family protein, TAC [Raoultella ornithinolytica]|uniref:phage tail assembly chaperone family protein, TAC n=1 Tax=Raoultella ornithinolytica TaxID=54291 RepID=UPI001F303350|nr:phage tail assembly chaperone family protein, TAC [Raoultella ornithinolytica]MCF6672315.1 phage tail assembly chaperone family protein, TAC [Raoultella ornithinolytica]
MQLTLDTLKETGAFTGRPVEKEIKWKGRDGTEHIATVFVRPMGYHTTKADLLAYNGKSDPVAERIAGNICDEGGKPIFTAADILGTASPERGALDGPIVVALLLAMQEVNELGKNTNSQEKMSSGVS